MNRPLTVCGSFRDQHTGDQALLLALQDLATGVGQPIDVHPLTRFPTTHLEGALGTGPNDGDQRLKWAGQPTLLAGGETITPANEAALLACSPYLHPPFAKSAAALGLSIESGVYYSVWKRMRLRKALKGLGPVTVRDQLSAKLFKSIIGKSPEVMGDLRLSLQAGDQLPEQLQGKERYLAVALSPWWRKEPAWYPWISQGLVNLAQQLDVATVVFLPTSTGAMDDRSHLQFIAAHVSARRSSLDVCVLDDYLDARLYAKVLQQAELTVAMHLSAAVISYAQQTPFVALLTHAKLAAFAQTVGCEANMVPNLALHPKTILGYGYRLHEIPLLSCNLAELGTRAFNETSFEALGPLQQKQREMFEKFASQWPTDSA